MSDTKTLAKEALVIIGLGPIEIYTEFTTERLIQIYFYAEMMGKWVILQELSRRESCPVDKILALAKSYRGELGMPIIKIAIQPKLLQMKLEDLLINLSRLNSSEPEKWSPLKDALRREILERLPHLETERILSISLGEDAEVVEAVKQLLHKRVNDLKTLAGV